jgi:hypothetical protein
MTENDPRERYYRSINDYNDGYADGQRDALAAARRAAAALIKVPPFEWSPQDAVDAIDALIKGNSDE